MPLAPKGLRVGLDIKHVLWSENQKFDASFKVSFEKTIVDDTFKTIISVQLKQTILSLYHVQTILF